MIKKITLNKAYIHREEYVRVIEIRKAFPRAGLPQRVIVQYADGSTRSFIGRQFREEAEYLPEV